MNTLKNARLTVHGRPHLVQRIVDDGLRPVEAAQAVGVSTRTAYKWLHRYRAYGEPGFAERSSRPRRCPHQLCPAKRDRIIALRRARRIYRDIGKVVDVPVSTVARVSRRAGVNRLATLEPAPAVRRYEHDAPGDLLHLDIKKLGASSVPGIASLGIGKPAAQAGRLGIRACRHR